MVVGENEEVVKDDDEPVSKFAKGVYYGSLEEHRGASYSFWKEIWCILAPRRVEAEPFRGEEVELELVEGIGHVDISKDLEAFDLEQFLFGVRHKFIRDVDVLVDGWVVADEADVWRCRFVGNNHSSGFGMWLLVQW